ncbi:acyl-CoA carboxylase subunit epsilon [Streptomyces sp. NBC_01803]|uniref:acyl-CoA carboxylase subunit epsilon n=1 Tax=Streptomyces sp. NBC_01803 TaxID=2975946 RepID=UPI002DD8A87D|nr:acyl-CoA carboxylase subunit epsilon [Streptomyces sp. NBC_01803]WSA44257.1 acyl-CoA carboxylase subunit epsilon [Streptomyces sp. NBC_01803]
MSAIRVVSGNPTREELAAVVAVLTARTSAPPAPPPGGEPAVPAPWVGRDDRPARGGRWHPAR